MSFMSSPITPPRSPLRFAIKYKCSVICLKMILFIVQIFSKYDSTVILKMFPSCKHNLMSTNKPMKVCCEKINLHLFFFHLEQGSQTQIDWRAKLKEKLLRGPQFEGKKAPQFINLVSKRPHIR